MAGSSRRRNIHGHWITGDPPALLALGRLSTHLLNELFRQAAEQGQAHITLEDVSFILQRNPDHTYALTPGTANRMML